MKQSLNPLPPVLFSWRNPLSQIHSSARVRSLQALLKPIFALVQNSSRLFVAPQPRFQVGDDWYSTPRFLFVGPQGGADFLRIGLFAGIFGDEIAGARALVEFLQVLENNPELARGYEIFVYPVVNVTGFEDGTRFTRSGHHLVRDIWNEARDPEIRILEEELRGMKFDGIISIGSDPELAQVGGYSREKQVFRDVLNVMLESGEKVIHPKSGKKEPFYFPPRNISLLHGERLVSRPFELGVSTPGNLPLEIQTKAHIAMLQAFLEEYRSFRAIAQNI